MDGILSDGFTDELEELAAQAEADALAVKGVNSPVKTMREIKLRVIQSHDALVAAAKAILADKPNCWTPNTFGNPECGVYEATVKCPSCLARAALDLAEGK